MTFAQWWGGLPLRYYGLGRHAETLFESRVRREDGVPYLEVKDPTGRRVFPRQMLGVERARAVFFSMQRGALS